MLQPDCNIPHCKILNRLYLIEIFCCSLLNIVAENNVKSDLPSVFIPGPN